MDNEIKPRRTRTPSAYNIFVKDFILSIKDDKSILPKDKLKLASQKWKEHKNKLPIEKVEVIIEEPKQPEIVVEVKKKKTKTKKISA